MLVEIRFGSRGCPSRGILMWQWEVPWPDHLLEIQRNNTKPCTVLVVEPAMQRGGNLPQNMVAIVGIR